MEYTTIHPGENFNKDLFPVITCRAILLHLYATGIIHRIENNLQCPSMRFGLGFQSGQAFLDR